MKEIENDLGINKIIVQDISQLDKAYQEAVPLGTYQDEDLKKFFNTMKTFDNAEKIFKNDFSKQYIKFDIVTDKERIPLNIRLGEGNFEKGFNHLINTGAIKTQKNEIDPNTKNKMDNFLRTPPPNKFDEMLDGSFKALQSVAEAGGSKDIGMIIASFGSAYGQTRENHRHKKAMAQTQGKEFFVKKIGEFFKKKPSSKQFEKELTTEKVLSKSR